MAFSLAKPSSAGHRDALNELARGRHEASAVVRSLLGWHSPPPGDGWRSEIECSTASGEVLSYSAGNPMAAGVPGDGEGGSGNDAGGLHGRKHSDSWTTVSCAPYDDGYHWRKYGEKKISKTKYTRSYFRCSYRDEEGCMATKHVQQKEEDDPPMFLVTYCHEHTCSCMNSLLFSD